MKVDMSAKAISARLKLVSQLRRLCLSLAKAKEISPEEKQVKSELLQKSVIYPSTGSG